MKKTIRVGIVGLGEVAQTVHIPILLEKSDLFRITGICDISPSLLALYQNLPDLKICSEDFNALASSDEIDLLYILNSDEYHADVAVAGLEAGKDVFIEKPLALTEKDALRIRKARGTNIVFVGYMRRFAPAFQALKEDLPRLGAPHYVNVRDIIGPNAYFVHQAHKVQYPEDLTDQNRREKQLRGYEMTREAVGEVSEDLKSAYRLLCGLGVHDLSLVRELFGLPARILSAHVWKGGSFIRATLDYGSFLAGYETGIDGHGRFDARLEVNGDKGLGTVFYNTPYIRHLPTLYERAFTEDDSFSSESQRISYKDPYSFEIEALYDCLLNRKEPKTHIEDSLEDLKLFKAIIKAADTGEVVEL